MNNISLVGFITKDSELKYLSGKGTACLTFTLAVNRGFKKEDGTDFINIVVYGNLAEKLVEFYTKGLRVSVVGRLKIDNKKNDDGSYSTYVNVIANDTRALSNKGKSEEGIGEPEDMGDSPF